MSLSQQQEQELKEAFALLDENNDGHLSKNELRSLLVGIGESVDDDVLNEMMALADLDGDGKVNFKEFVRKF